MYYTNKVWNKKVFGKIVIMVKAVKVDKKCKWSQLDFVVGYFHSKTNSKINTKKKLKKKHFFYSILL